MMLCLQHGTARILLSGTCPNPAKSMAGAGFGRICHKRPDAGPAGAEIRYIPTTESNLCLKSLHFNGAAQLL